MRHISFGSLARVSVLALALVIPTGIAAAEEAPATLTVGGIGTAQIAPDTAEITVGVITEAKDAAKAHADNAAATARIHSAVKGLGIADRDITVRNLNNVSKVIDTALANGANRIDSLNFTVSDTSAAKNAALADAVRSAQSKAQAMAGALGVRLVRIANVYADAQSAPPRNYMPMMMAKESYDSSTPISAGELSVEATVNITYVIQ